MIGWFHCVVANLKSLLELKSFPSIWMQRYNKFLANFVSHFKW